MKTFFHWIIKIWFHCLNTTNWKRNYHSFSHSYAHHLYFVLYRPEPSGTYTHTHTHAPFVWTFVALFNSDFGFQSYLSKLTQKNESFFPSWPVVAVVVDVGQGMARRSHVTIQQCAQRIKIQHIWKAIHLIWKRQRGFGNDIVFFIFVHISLWAFVWFPAKVPMRSSRVPSPSSLFEKWNMCKRSVIIAIKVIIFEFLSFSLSFGPIQMNHNSKCGDCWGEKACGNVHTILYSIHLADGQFHFQSFHLCAAILMGSS